MNDAGGWTLLPGKDRDQSFSFILQRVLMSCELMVFLQLELLILDVRQVIVCGTKGNLHMQPCRACDGGLSNTR